MDSLNGSTRGWNVCPSAPIRRETDTPHPRPAVATAVACCLALIAALSVPLAARADRAPGDLNIRQTQGSPRLELPTAPVAPVAGSTYRLYIESSTDLKQWRRTSELSLGSQGQPQAPATNGLAQGFFRLRPEVELTPAAGDGAEVYGYNRIFDEELRRVGWLTPQSFSDQASLAASTGGYLEGIRFDPRSAKSWDAFNADPAVVNAGKTPFTPGYRSVDFRLNPEELGLFLTHGFVVSERLGAPNAVNYMAGNSTFAGVFYRVFFNDLPVFISTDSALHAWHFSYQRMLAELEETELVPRLTELLDGMAGALGKLPASVRTGPLKDNLSDADYFLTVGRNLLSGKPVAPVLGPHPGLGPTLSAIQDQKYLTGFPMFGGPRDIDFSQYAVRGYYDRSLELSNYFRAFMWTARADLRIFDPENLEQSRRELGTALVLSALLHDSGRTASWRSLDDLLRLFVGRTDAMNFLQLDPLLAAAGLGSLGAVVDPAQIASLQSSIVKGELGRQSIPGDVYFSPFGPEQTQLPRAFVFSGQRFIADGWAMAQVTFDRVLWQEDIPGLTLFRKVLRREPSGLDVAYSVLGNRAAGPELARHMLETHLPGNFRDGFPYAHNLEALAATFDRLEPAAWTDSLYARWLAALRSLSRPTTDPSHPEAMRTRAWSMRTLGTQMASYSELKHDTLLYGKQPYANNFVCEYPAGFVEPVPQFWQAMRVMAEAAATGLEAAMKDGVGTASVTTHPGWPPLLLSRASRQLARARYCRYFAAQMATLETMAAKELRQEAFSTNEVAFVRGLMNAEGGCGLLFNGWYPGLYYNDYSVTSANYGEIGQAAIDGQDTGCNRPDQVVADVFTAAPDQLDPVGGVLHLATGDIDLMLIAVDNGPDRRVYAGPVLSHYEFLEPGPTLKRLTDTDWRARLGGRPARPDWTRSYLVPAR